MSNEIDWTKLNKPSPLFTRFAPTEEKLVTLEKQLRDGYLNLPDEHRKYVTIQQLMIHYLGNLLNFVYEIGDFGGIFGFVNIVPSQKCDIIFKMWAKDIWKPSLIKESKKLIDLIINTFNLIRVNADTPDERVLRMAKMVGFKEEFTRENDFLWNGQLYPRYYLSIIREK